MIYQYICVHHTGGLVEDEFASTANLTAYHINKAHQKKWNFKSSLNYYGGYNFFIDKEGVITQFRSIGEETAAQKGHNWDVISICLAGNFTAGIDTPTDKQKETLKQLTISLLNKNISHLSITPDAKLDIKYQNIVPHRYFNPTSCYGAGLNDNWARTLLDSYLQDKLGLLKKLYDLYLQLVELRNKIKLGSSQKDKCELWQRD